MSDEKVLHDSMDPLILRPPVGAEVHTNLGPVQFSTLFNSVGDPRRRKHLLFHCFLSTFLALVAVAVLLLVLFVLGIGPLLPSHQSHEAHSRQHRSMCRVFIPSIRFRVTEFISSEDDMFNVTLFDGDIGNDFYQSETLRIMHLCKNGWTVLRTRDGCFIRPMRLEWRQACANSQLRLLQDESKLRTSVNAQLKDEILFTEPPEAIPSYISNSYIMSWCEGVPTLRLVLKPPSNNYVIDSTNPSASDEEVHQELSASFDNTATSEDKGDQVFNRFARDVTKKEELLDGTHQSSDPPVHCHIVASLIEDVVLTPFTESSQVSITRDKILQCDSARP